MTKQEYTQETIKRWTEENFKNHEASVLVALSDGNPVQSSVVIIQWKKPGTWTYGMRFIVHSQWLCVMGDCGEAIYQWSDRLTLEFLGKIDYGYMMGKCRAASTNGGRRGWDERVWARELSEVISEMRIRPRQNSDAIRALTQELELKSPRDEYQGTVAELYQHDLIDSDMAEELHDLGEVPDFMSIGHHVGLQMAIKQLEKMPPV